MAPAGATQGPGPALGQPQPDPPGVLELVIVADAWQTGRCSARECWPPFAPDVPPSAVSRASTAPPRRQLARAWEAAQQPRGAWACSAHASSTAHQLARG